MKKKSESCCLMFECFNVNMIKCALQSIYSLFQSWGCMLEQINTGKLLNVYFMYLALLC